MVRHLIDRRPALSALSPVRGVTSLPPCLVQLRGGSLRMQKWRSLLQRIQRQLSKFTLLKPELGQNKDLHGSSTPRNSAFFLDTFFFLSHSLNFIISPLNPLPLVHKADCVISVSRNLTLWSDDFFRSDKTLEVDWTLEYQESVNQPLIHVRFIGCGSVKRHRLLTVFQHIVCLK